MKIAVLSGKGGTGKTLVSVNLASIAENSVYIDCDVEEPNGHLYFKPDSIKTQKVSVWVPLHEEEKCMGCKKCVDFCKFNALAMIKNSFLVFDEICHSCGGCIMLCPQGALSEMLKEVGEIKKGRSKGVTVITGILNTGEASGVPVIQSLMKDAADENCTVVIDCPPGSSCTVTECIKEADYCVLVAEPTLFGVHNLKMVYELISLFDKPLGAVLNKCLDHENPSEEFCLKNGIKILARIPFSQNLGYITSNGTIAVMDSSEYRGLFTGLLNAITEEVSHEAAVNSQR